MLFPSCSEFKKMFPGSPLLKRRFRCAFLSVSASCLFLLSGLPASGQLTQAQVQSAVYDGIVGVLTTYPYGVAGVQNDAPMMFPGGSAPYIGEYLLYSLGYPIYGNGISVYSQLTDLQTAIFSLLNDVTNISSQVDSIESYLEDVDHNIDTMVSDVEQARDYLYAIDLNCSFIQGYASDCATSLLALYGTVYANSDAVGSGSSVQGVHDPKTYGIVSEIDASLDGLVSSFDSLLAAVGSLHGAFGDSLATNIVPLLENIEYSLSHLNGGWLTESTYQADREEDSSAGEEAARNATADFEENMDYYTQDGNEQIEEADSHAYNIATNTNFNFDMSTDNPYSEFDQTESKITSIYKGVVGQSADVYNYTGPDDLVLLGEDAATATFANGKPLFPGLHGPISYHTSELFEAYGLRSARVRGRALCEFAWNLIGVASQICLVVNFVFGVLYGFDRNEGSASDKFSFWGE